MADTESFRDAIKWNSVVVPERVALRAFTNVEKMEDGCWISKYSVASHGYAQIGWTGEGRTQMVLAHRASWVHVNGQVPVGMTIDHLCKNRRCANVEHMRILSNYENARRTAGRDWSVGYCVNGHDPSHQVFVTRNANASGRTLICGTCLKASRLRWEIKNSEKSSDSKRNYSQKKKNRTILQGEGLEKHGSNS